jgi:4-amino-4-deoxy-L-arabinose transferase-like glycosyltransferase
MTRGDEDALRASATGGEARTADRDGENERAAEESFDWGGLGTILAAALVLRVVVGAWLLGSMPMVSDARDYYDVAVRFAAGDARGAFYWPPGESALLAAFFRLFGPSLDLARAITIAIGTATVALTAGVARELAGKRAARLAGWIAALYPPAVLLAGQTYAQHLAALCLAAAAYASLRAVRTGKMAHFAATGLALGVGCLTRPSMLSVAPVIAMAWALVGRRTISARPLALGALLAAGLSLALVGAACLHDARAGVGFTISTNNERNLFLGNNPYTPDYKTSHLGQRSLEELAPEARAYLESYYERPDGRAAMRRAALAYMIEHPARTSFRTLNRTTSFWGFDYLASREIQKWLGWSTKRSMGLLLVEGVSYLAVAALALVALVTMRANRAAEGVARAWLVALALAYELPYTIAFSGGTYHFPVMPLAIALAAIAASEPGRAWRSLRGSAPGGVALAGLALIEAQYAYYAVAMSP